MDERRYAGSNLNKAEAVFAEAIYHRPRIRLTCDELHSAASSVLALAVLVASMP